MDRAPGAPQPERRTAGSVNEDASSVPRALLAGAGPALQARAPVNRVLAGRRDQGCPRPLSREVPGQEPGLPAPPPGPRRGQPRPWCSTHVTGSEVPRPPECAARRPRSREGAGRARGPAFRGRSGRRTCAGRASCPRCGRCWGSGCWPRARSCGASRAGRAPAARGPRGGGRGGRTRAAPGSRRAWRARQ